MRIQFEWSIERKNIVIGELAIGHDNGGVYFVCEYGNRQGQQLQYY